MPDARTHDQITIATGVALVPLAYTLQMSQGGESGTALGYTLLLVGAHLLSGIMFSPDLDLDSRIDDRWGILFWIWRPYTWLVPHRHRWLSHGLIISQLLRLLYFYVVVVLLLAGLTWVLGQIDLVVPNYYIQLTNWLLNLARDRPRETLAFMIGFCSGGAVHTIADWLVTGGKRYLRSIGIRVTRDYYDHDHWRPRTDRYRARSWGE
jgi:uncharacterized metal-binding protein